MEINEYEYSWKVVKAWAEQEIETLRTDLERSDVEWDQVIEIRAEIHRLRALLGLPKEIENGTARIDPERIA